MTAVMLKITIYTYYPFRLLLSGAPIIVFDELYIQMGRKLSQNMLTTISNKYAYLSRYPQADGPDSN